MHVWVLLHSAPMYVQGAVPDILQNETLLTADSKAILYFHIVPLKKLF